MRCHQCGSLFSNEGNPSCERFDRNDPSQAGECAAGEACLWYSWERSRGRTSFVRECFSTSILLGTVSDPLLPSSSCSPRDISETPTSARISACLCTSDYCNGYISQEERRELSRPVTTSRPATRRTTRRTTTIRTTTTRRTTQAPEPAEEPRRQAGLPGRQNIHPEAPGLQCYSCGSLLNPNKKCGKFDRSAKSQVQTCLTDEACLMYTWQKSPTETATLRECFPTRVLLGSIEKPLSASDSCTMRDITDDGSGTIRACLCTSDFCNDLPEGASPRQLPQRTPQPTRRTTRRPAPRPASSARQQSSGRRSNCPDKFVLSEGNCYLVSSDRVGWIEARKMCERQGAVLAALPSREVRDLLEKLVRRRGGRRRADYWVAGNDIEKEGRWVVFINWVELSPGGSGPTLAGSLCQTGGGQNNLLIQTRKTVSLGVSAPLLLFGED